MFKRFSIKENSFERYFKEAPGDEGDSVSVTVAPRKNRGTDYSDDTNNVTVAPRANRGADYGADDDTDDAGAAQDAAPAEPNLGNDNGTDYGADDTAPAPAPADDAGGGDTPAEPDTGTDNGTDYGAEGDDAGGGEDTGADDTAGDEEGEDNPDGPNLGDDDGTDYGAEGDDAGGDEDTEGGDDTGEGEDNPEDLEEKNRKFNMYKKFIKLYNAINGIMEKLKNIVKDDPNENAVIKRVSNNLDNLFDNLHDYMVYKYKTSTYIQIKIYYEYVITLIKLNYELLQNNKIFINK